MATNNSTANKLKQMLSQLDDRPRYTGTLQMPWELAKEITYNDYNKADDILSMIRARQNGGRAQNHDFQTYKRVVKTESLANGIVEIEHVVHEEVTKKYKKKIWPVGTKVTILATSATTATVEFPDGEIREFILGELGLTYDDMCLVDLCTARDESRDFESEIEADMFEDELRPKPVTWTTFKKPKLFLQ